MEEIIKKLEELEKRVAALEGQVQAQPNQNEKVNLSAELLSGVICTK